MDSDLLNPFLVQNFNKSVKNSLKDPDTPKINLFSSAKTVIHLKEHRKSIVISSKLSKSEI